MKEIYEKEANENYKLKVDFQFIQKEAAKEWNTRQSELINQIQNFEQRIQQLENNSTVLNEENVSLLDKLAKVSHLISFSFTEIFELIRLENPKLKINFEIERIGTELIESMKMIESNQKSNRHLSLTECHKVIHISDLSDYENRLVSGERNSLSSLSNFLEDTYQCASTKNQYFKHETDYFKNKEQKKKEFEKENLEKNTYQKEICITERENESKRFLINKNSYYGEDMSFDEFQSGKQKFSNEIEINSRNKSILQNIGKGSIGSNKFDSNFFKMPHENEDFTSNSFNLKYTLKENDSGETFRTISDDQFCAYDSFRTLREATGNLENAITDIFPPINLENTEILRSNIIKD